MYRTSRFPLFILGLVSAACSPIVIDERELCGAGEVTVFAEHQPWPFALALDAAHVYWSDLSTNAIMVAPKSGGVPSVFAVNVPAATWIGVDDTAVYFLTHPEQGSRQIYAISKAGGSAPKLVVETNFVNHAVLDHERIYWSGNALSFAPKSGGAKTVLYDAGVNAFALDQEHAYWLDIHENALVSAPRLYPTLDEKPSHIININVDALSNTFGLAIDDDWLYYWYDSAIVAVPKSGGTQTPLASETEKVRNLLVDQGCLFWTTDPDEVNTGKVRAARRGGEVVTLADGLASGNTFIVEDGSAFYWVDATEGAIMKLAR